jgi:hypothetical protein
LMDQRKDELEQLKGYAWMSISGNTNLYDFNIEMNIFVKIDCSLPYAKVLDYHFFVKMY